MNKLHKFVSYKGKSKINIKICEATINLFLYKNVKIFP